MKNTLFEPLKIVTLILLLIIVQAQHAWSQVPTCDPNVPFFQVNLTGYPAGVFESPTHSRQGNCCSTHSPDRCTSFEVILDSNAAMINFEIASGAVPPGSMFYQIGCGPQIPVGQPICIVGPGPHHITFCKPGNNENTYRITSIPRPTFPPNDTVRIGCTTPISVLGMEQASITWQSVYPGVPDQYNSYLSCTSNCDTNMYTPDALAPAYIDYKICGYPIADECGYVAVCDTIRIYNFSALTGSVTPNPGTFCAGGSGVSLVGTPSGGSAPYSYIWRDQSSNVVGGLNNYNASTAGIYQLEIRDGLYNSAYCPATFISVPVIVTQPPAVDAGFNQTICYNDPQVFLNGTVTNASGATWSGGNGIFSPNNNFLDAVYTPTPAEISAGSVQLMLTSFGAGGGCVNGADTVTIYFTSPININVISQSVSCANDSTSLNALVSGGVAPYSYLWTTGETSASITVPAGTFCVMVTDANGCAEDPCANVIEPTPLSLFTTSTDVTVNGGNDGTATAMAGGGNDPYTYLWNSTPAQTTPTANNLPYGIYEVIVTDSNGCSISSSVVVNEPRCAGLEGVLQSLNNALCYGDHNGSASITISGGTSPYSILWNDPLSQTNDTVIGLGAGVYQALITDMNLCFDLVNVAIVQPNYLYGNITQTNVSTEGGNDGSASINSFGGTPGYTYVWQDSIGNIISTSSTASGLVAGWYFATISDNHGCNFQDSVYITQPPCNNLIISVTTSPATCQGVSNGSATVTVLLGIAPYNYTWTDASNTIVGTGASLSNVPAGNYAVAVSDNNNCEAFSIAIINQPSQLSAVASVTQARCFNTYDATVEVTVSGGIFPYYYSWTNGLMVEDLYNLNNGNYAVTVTDANGCEDTLSVVLTPPTILTAGISVTNVTCYNGTNGSINLSPSGGVAPYGFNWSNGGTTEDINTLTSGVYSVFITDQNGCHTPQSVAAYVAQPAPILNDSTSIHCPVPGSGSSFVQLFPSGGSGTNYQASFDNGTSFNPTDDMDTYLPVDSTYYVVIKDSNNCVSFLTDTIHINSEVLISAITFESCIPANATEALVEIAITGGEGNQYQVSFNNGSVYGIAGIHSDSLMVDSSYIVIVKDSLGCISLTDTITIAAPIQFSGIISDYNGVNVSCNGSLDGEINVTMIGWTTPYSYNWSNGSTNEDLNDIGNGSYQIIVTDANNCRDTLIFSLTQPQELMIEDSILTDYNGFHISCFGSNDASIDATVSGGTLPYNYDWSNGSINEDISNISAGSYQLVVVDLNGCTDSINVDVLQPDSIQLSYANQNILCYGYGTGNIDVTTTGGVANYTFDWNNGSTTEDLTNVVAGNYQLIMTDANGCQDSISITMTEPTLLEVTSSEISILCFGDSTGSIDVTPTGGTGTYSYNWSNGETDEDLTDISAGNYTLIISDQNGCADTLDYAIDQPSLLVTSILSLNDFNGYDISCNGSLTGAIDVSANGGVGPYGYIWSTNDTTQDLSSLPAGNYTVTINDANSCTSTLSITLSEPTLLDVSANISDVPCFGYANGAIDITVNGGVSNYQYNWAGGATSEDIANLGPGTYSVTITDANGCTLTYSGTVTEFSAIEIDAIVSNVLCYGNANGIINASLTGGLQPYSYSWSNGANTEDLDSAIAGTYILIVTDSNNCTAVDTIVVTEPDLLQLSLTASTYGNNGSTYNVSEFGATDGFIYSSILGGTVPYQYTWSTGDETEDLSNVPAGMYVLIVEDENACTVTDTIILLQPDFLQIPTGYTPNNDGYNDAFIVKGLDVYPDNHLTIINRWGNVVFEKDGYNNDWRGESNDNLALPDGTYFVILEVHKINKKFNSYVDIRR